MSQSSGTPTFTQASQALATIVDRFKTDTLPLEEALALFEQGITHVAQCQKLLSATEGRLVELNTLLAEASTPSTSDAKA
jgi:exodeoxyribonuclease VII small subunit